jgi:hypothetical protein
MEFARTMIGMASLMAGLDFAIVVATMYMLRCIS